MISPSFGELPTLGPRVGKFLSLDVKDKKEGGETKIHIAGPDITKYNDEERVRTLRDLPDGGRIKIEPEQTVTVEWKYKTQRRYADTYAWVTIVAARNLTLIAKKKGNGVTDLQFALNTAHRLQEGDKEVKITEPKPDEKQWVVDAAFLPYQGVTLHWYPASKVTKP
jgi:hypothetical protein